ncbi:MAG: hypothetical protein H0V27_12065 [Pyrinomonadaceae bacterium]|nr:hypothetical protein [Pyrinomonadaceae bacterium]
MRMSPINSVYNLRRQFSSQYRFRENPALEGETSRERTVVVSASLKEKEMWAQYNTPV